MPMDTYNYGTSAPMPGTSSMVSFDSQELDQYFPDNKGARLPPPVPQLQNHGFCPVSTADNSTLEYTTLQSSYTPYDYQSMYTNQQEEGTPYYPQSSDWLNQSAAGWIKHY